MNYYRELAFALRTRGLSEDDIRSTLLDVQTHAVEAGQSPQAAFGDPDEFAERFDRATTTTTGRRFVSVMTVLAVASVLALFVVSKSLDIQLRVAGLSVPLFTGVAILIIGFVGGFILDRRLPRNFKLDRNAP